jgi:hypothetical protein
VPHAQRAGAAVPADDRLVYLASVMPPTPWFELRTRTRGDTWTKHWPDDAEHADRLAHQHALAGDEVYAALAARAGQNGQQATTYGPTAVLWCDADTARSVAKVGAFDPQPTLVVRSGSDDAGTPKVHCYWKLSEPVPAAAAAAYSARLARHLDADAASTDPARILRVPGSVNFKTGRVCRTETFTGEVFTPDEVLADVPAADPQPAQAKAKTTSELIDLFAGHYRDGEGRHDHYRSVAGVLLRRCDQLPPDVLLELAVAWAATHTHPTKGRAELERNFDNLLEREQARRGL